MIITYELGDKLYINLTNRCSNRCTFCLRGESKDYKLHEGRWKDSTDIGASNELWLPYEPTTDEIIEDLKKRDLSKYAEVVFWGFGEPFVRFDDCVVVAKWLKENNVTVRVNTNGHANLIHKKDVTSEMKGLFDVVSISLNATNAADYNKICRCAFGEKGYDALLDFAKKTSSLGIETVLSVVDIMPKEDIEKCEAIAKDCGATLRVRKYLK